MATCHRVLSAGVLLLLASSAAHACEPVLPFIQSVAPLLALSGSLLTLAGAVVVKCGLFSFFEPRFPRLGAAWRMFVGNLLTTVVGVIVAAMIGSGPIWLIGVPVVGFLCWLPARRLIRVAPLAWLKRLSPGGIATIMTCAMVVSCILFGFGQVAISTHHLPAYWIVKLVAIFLALAPSVTLTTVWEEWVIWRLSSRPEGTAYFTSVLRTNLYALVLVILVPAAMILPRRLKSPDFLAKRPAITQTTDSGR